MKYKNLIYILVFYFLFNFSASVHADIFNIYTDAGIPPSPSTLWTWGHPGSLHVEIFDQESPERVKNYKTQSTLWAGWGIFFTQTGQNHFKDLTKYADGSLKFFVKSPHDLKVEIESPIGTKHYKYISSYGWDGINQWQEISIPINDFDADLEEVFSPFMITAESACIFHIDDVRWEIPISGYTPSRVTISERSLFVDGEKFIIKGVSGEFTPVGYWGPSYDWTLYPESYNIDLPLISQMNANVVRSYDQPSQSQALDALFDNGLYLMVGFPVDVIYGDAGQYVVDFSNSIVRENIKARFLRMVEHWKDHPAILMWSIGNEVNLALENKGVWPGYWYSLIEECAAAARQLQGESYRPITTANADQIKLDIGDPSKNADDDSLPSLDIWSLQSYRGKSFGSLFEDYALLSNKPLLISEFGCDAWNGLIGQEDQTMQAQYLDFQWKEIYFYAAMNTAERNNYFKSGMTDNLFSYREVPFNLVDPRFCRFDQESIIKYYDYNTKTRVFQNDLGIKNIPKSFFEEKEDPLKGDLYNVNLKKEETSLKMGTSVMNIGGILFAFRDGWWKSEHGNEWTHDTQADWMNHAYSDPHMNEEWFGVVAISTNPTQRILRQGYYLLQNLWGSELYLLNVYSGLGSGIYLEGDVVVIEADEPSAGMMFKEWTGDTSYVLDVNSPSTTINMPDKNITVTATYQRDHNAGIFIKKQTPAW